MLQAMLEFSAKNPTLVTVAVSIFLAFVGYFVKYVNDLAIARRRDQLDRVNGQLRLLYGPLFALTKASETSWKDFRRQYRPSGPFFTGSQKPTELELQAWRLWMSNVFMPLNRRMMEAIISNADLLDGEMPSEFQELVAHVAAYQVVFARWQANDFSEHLSSNNFPKGFAHRVQQDYERLRATQSKLLSQRKLGSRTD